MCLTDAMCGEILRQSPLLTVRFNVPAAETTLLQLFRNAQLSAVRAGIFAQLTRAGEYRLFVHDAQRRLMPANAHGKIGRTDTARREL